MKRKILSFASMFGLNCLIFLVWEDWSLTDKQIVEMIFISTFVSFCYVLLERPLTRFIQSTVKKILS